MFERRSRAHDRRAWRPESHPASRVRMGDPTARIVALGHQDANRQRHDCSLIPPLRATSCKHNGSRLTTTLGQVILARTARNPERRPRLPRSALAAWKSTWQQAGPSSTGHGSVCAGSRFKCSATRQSARGAWRHSRTAGTGSSRRCPRPLLCRSRGGPGGTVRALVLPSAKLGGDASGECVGEAIRVAPRRDIRSCRPDCAGSCRRPRNQRRVR